MNYGQLKAEVLDIAKLTTADTVGARVAKFVARAERMIARRVRALEMVAESLVNDATRVNPGSGSYNLPAGAIDVISIGSGATRVARCSLEELLRYNTAGEAHHYAVRVIAGVLRVDFRGIPAAGSTLGAVHLSMPAALAADGDTNALLTAHEELYLHGALSWLYYDAHMLALAKSHDDAFNVVAKEVNAAAKVALRAGSIAAVDYNFFTRSAM